MQRDGWRTEEMNLQAAHLPRKAPKDTLPMPVANIQKQKKCSRNRVSAVQRLAVRRETEREREKETGSNKSTELRAEQLRNTWVALHQNQHRAGAVTKTVHSILHITNNESSYSSAGFKAHWYLHCAKMRKSCVLHKQ